MTSTFLILLFSVFTSVFATEASLRFEYGEDFDRQPMLVNGTVIRDASDGNESALARHNAICASLASINHPLKVLDLGANNGFYSLKLAADFPGDHYVMVDNVGRLADLCMANIDRNNITNLRTGISSSFITDLSKRELFDVILYLNNEGMTENKYETIAKLKQMCSYLIIETNEKALFFQHKHTLLGQFISTSGEIDYLVLLHGQAMKPENIGIKSSTFFALNGQFPRPVYLSEKFPGHNSYMISGVESK